MGKSKREALLHRLGEQKLKELTQSHTVQEVQLPVEASLRVWLADGIVAGKFVPWWHQQIAEAREWRIEISPAWDVIAASLDVLFPGTANTWNVADPRPAVKEAELLAYLEKRHGIKATHVGTMQVIELAAILQQDAHPRTSLAASSTSRYRPRKCPTCGRQMNVASTRRRHDGLGRIRHLVCRNCGHTEKAS